MNTVCPYCGVGCGMERCTSRTMRSSRSAGNKDPSLPISDGFARKGATSAQALSSRRGRLDGAYRLGRAGARPKCACRLHAMHIAETARRLCAIRDAHGPDALAFYVSGQMSLESQYLINKLAKGYIGTNNVDSNSRLCMSSAAAGYKLSLGADAPPGSYQDMDRADLFFIIGANMADCHPILFLRVLDRVKAGAKMIVVDPRRSPDGGQGRPVPADQGRHRHRAAQRAALTCCARNAPCRCRAFVAAYHRGLGRPVRFPRRFYAPATLSPPRHGAGGGRHPARGAA